MYSEVSRTAFKDNNKHVNIQNYHEIFFWTRYKIQDKPEGNAVVPHYFSDANLNERVSIAAAFLCCGIIFVKQDIDVIVGLFFSAFFYIL